MWTNSITLVAVRLHKHVNCIQNPFGLPTSNSEILKAAMLVSYLLVDKMEQFCEQSESVTSRWLEVCRTWAGGARHPFQKHMFNKAVISMHTFKIYKT